MISVADLRQKAERRYEAVLRAIVTGESLFPMPMPVNKRLPNDLTQRRRELADLMAHTTERRGFGYELTYRRVQTRHHNEQDEIEAVQFPTEPDYLRFVGKAAEADLFRADVALLLGTFPDLREWCAGQPLKVVASHGGWPDLLRVCQYFRHNPTPGCYVRELPVAVHTKFIETNRPLLHELLNHLVTLPPDQEAETDFYRRFGLREKESSVRIRFVGDPLITSAGPVREMSVPVSTFGQLTLPERDVFIIENEINFLTFPPRPNTLVLWGKGFDLGTIKTVGWLAQKRLFYWSDLDVQGFEMLSQLRGYFPHTPIMAWLMDAATLHRYKDFWVPGTYKNLPDLPNLLPDERPVFQFLQQQNLRLEQERITQADVLAGLGTLAEQE